LPARQCREGSMLPPRSSFQTASSCSMSCFSFGRCGKCTPCRRGAPSPLNHSVSSFTVEARTWVCKAADHPTSHESMSGTSKFIWDTVQCVRAFSCLASSRFQNVSMQATTSLFVASPTSLGWGLPACTPLPAYRSPNQSAPGTVAPSCDPIVADPNPQSGESSHPAPTRGGYQDYVGRAIWRGRNLERVVCGWGNSGGVFAKRPSIRPAIGKG